MTELLAPAGTLEKLEYAFAFGADAVYAGIPFFSLRARRNEFTLDDLAAGVRLARDQGKKLYLTANIFARNRKIPSFLDRIGEWAALQPDALIMSDPGLMMLVRERHPEIPIHLSVQANCMNWEAVRFWARQGVERIILSRELTLDEIRTIHEKVPEVELEAFVHGAICIAYSGRCLMSSYMSYRDANQGVCDNSCREKFNVLVEDRRSPGEFYRMDEDENGTYIMNAKDLRLVENLREIVESGVCSLKIEGRTKSLYYVSMVTRAYRRAIDDLAAGRAFDPTLLHEFDKIPNRGYHKGFLLGAPGATGQNYETSSSFVSKQNFGGVVKAGAAKFPGWIPVEIRGPVNKGDGCELITPSGSWRFPASAIRNDEGAEVDRANPGYGGIFHFPVDAPVPAYGLLSVDAAP
ncbi:MAG: U32 family peptidase C-terminal domain-containing protein [Bdellovibrionales bacterium]|nr:U32 family peptidase C-terminal domain-containing protein [Bdellovibrionales bacterium]